MQKAIIFDFEGTLTKKNQNIWKMLWEICGYETDKSSLYSKLYVGFVVNKKITREECFNLTCEAFKNKNLSYSQLYSVSKSIELTDRAKELILKLYNSGYKLFIVSGSIIDTIELVLGDYVKYFEAIEANKCVFDSNGKLQKLILTDYDYEGKAKFIELLKEQGYTKDNIVFIGNGYNDEWAYKTGCLTICFKPIDDDINNLNKRQSDIYKKQDSHNPKNLYNVCKKLR